MKQITIYLATFLAVSVFYLLALPLQKIVTFPLTGLVHTIDGIIVMIIASKLWRDPATRQSTNSAKTYFLYFFITVGIFQLIMGLTHLILYINAGMFVEVMNWGYIIGHVFLYLSLALALMVPLELIFPGKKIKYYAASLIGIFGLAITYINITKPTHPVYESTTGITFFNVDPAVGGLIPIIVLLSWGVAAIMFIINGIKSRRNRIVLVRSLVISVGFIITIVGGPLHDVAKTSAQFLIADILTLLGFLTLASGIALASGPDEQSSVPVAPQPLSQG